MPERYDDRIENLISELESTGDFRVLRRMPRSRACQPSANSSIGAAVLVDLETTGTDPKSDAILEIALLRFEYEKESGRICHIEEPISFLEDPGYPIPPGASAINGITDETVSGKRIDDGIVNGIVERSAILIAHNASFDRKLFEKRFPSLTGLPWACSMREVPWRDQGASSLGLDYLLYRRCGYFYDGHRAEEDCRALLEVLTAPFASGALPLRLLLESARRRTLRIWAVGSPIDRKDLLKARGYRWNNGEDARHRSWSREVPEAERESELAWLRDTIYEGTESDLPIDVLDARKRYAD